MSEYGSWYGSAAPVTGAAGKGGSVLDMSGVTDAPPGLHLEYHVGEAGWATAVIGLAGRDGPPAPSWSRPDGP